MRQIVGLLALGLAACKPADGSQAEPTPEPSASAVTSPTSAPSATPSATPTATSGARSVQEETDDFLFEYAYPKEAGQIAPLAALLDAKLASTRAGLVTEAAAARRETRANGFPYNKHSAQVKWQVAADLPQWLSLSSETASYRGGDHGAARFESLVWDKPGARAIDAMAIFTTPAALDKALSPQLCRRLEAERAKRREGAPEADTQVVADTCPSIAKGTVVLGSRGRARFDRITVRFTPDAAGPYAEGEYQFDFPVNKAVLETVKPEFRPAFAARN